MKQKHRIIVSAVIISKDNKILLGKVREGGAYPDCWHIPGGGVDTGETSEEALVREIQEEIGVSIKKSSLTLLSEGDTGEAIKTDKDTGEQFLVHMQFTVYQVDLDKASDEVEISLNDDLKEYQWVSKSQLFSYKHTPPSERLFRKLGWM